MRRLIGKIAERVIGRVGRVIGGTCSRLNGIAARAGVGGIVIYREVLIVTSEIRRKILIELIETFGVCAMVIDGHQISQHGAAATLQKSKTDALTTIFVKFIEVGSGGGEIIVAVISYRTAGAAIQILKVKFILLNCLVIRAV